MADDKDDFNAKMLFCLRDHISQTLSGLDFPEAIAVLILVTTETLVKASPTKEAYDHNVEKAYDMMRFMPELVEGVENMLNGNNSVKH
jgi:hypothetical protein